MTVVTAAGQRVVGARIGTRRRIGRLLLTAGALAVAAVPLVTSNTYTLSVLILIFLLTILRPVGT